MRLCLSLCACVREPMSVSLYLSLTSSLCVFACGVCVCLCVFAYPCFVSLSVRACGRACHLPLLWVPLRHRNAPVHSRLLYQHCCIPWISADDQGKITEALRLADGSWTGGTTMEGMMAAVENPDDVVPAIARWPSIHAPARTGTTSVEEDGQAPELQGLDCAVDCRAPLSPEREHNVRRRAMVFRLGHEPARPAAAVVSVLPLTARRCCSRDHN